MDISYIYCASMEWTLDEDAWRHWQTTRQLHPTHPQSLGAIDNYPVGKIPSFGRQNDVST